MRSNIGMKKHTFILLMITIGVLASCSNSGVPKPYGYFRIDLPEHRYTLYSSAAHPFIFEHATIANVKELNSDQEGYWLDVTYPTLNAKVHCSYKPVHHNLRQLNDDAQEFVFKHAGMASSIPEQGFENPEHNVYGVLFELHGNTASPCQFYMTDSTHHFFRGALYFECAPNQDSLAPVIDYVLEDTRHLIETLRWTR